MPLQLHVTADGVRVPLALARVADLARAVLRAERVRDAAISFTFVSRRAIAAMNRRHLGHRGATDIITFELPAIGDGPPSGDVYLAPEIAREHALQFGSPVREEIARLVVHGTLHAIGYTHPEDVGRTESEMWVRQESYVQRLFVAPARRVRSTSPDQPRGGRMGARTT